MDNVLIMQLMIKNSFLKYKERVAVNYKGNNYSYHDLAVKTDYIANIIVGKNIKPGSSIGILLDDKYEFLSALIGVLKARCIVVPLDSNYPIKRTQYMINDSNIDYVFTDNINMDYLNDINKDIQKIIIDEQFYNTENVSNFDFEYDKEDKIYVYYTSGTTGNPKGIVGKNKSLAHYIKWEIEEFKLEEYTDGVKVSQFTSQCHDPYLRDIFVPLCCGGTICIPSSKDFMLDSDKVIQWIDESHINLIHCTPSLFGVFNTNTLTDKNFIYLNYILLAGEKVVPNTLKNWYNIFSNRIQLVNMYGPTETTLVKMFYRINPEDTKLSSIPIGKPISKTKAVVLNDDMKMCIHNEVGTIYIRTPYMSYGYLNNEEENKKKFIKNPFSDNEKDIIYNTGDLGKITNSNDIVFIGRKDRQIKIRGYRVELDEIEQVMLKNELIKSVIITTYTLENSNEILVAYIIPKDLNELNEENTYKEKLEQYANSILPNYMVPQCFIMMEQFPMNNNGKIDYKALPNPNLEFGKTYVAPTNETEKILCSLYEEILNVEKVGIDDNFFRLGGHSLKAMNLVLEINKKFNKYITLNKIFGLPTVRQLSDYIINQVDNEFVSIPKAENKEFYEASSSQKRMYMLQEFDKENTVYNIPKVLKLSKDTDFEKVKLAFDKIVERHDSFKTYFEIIDNIIVQKIDKKAKLDIVKHDISDKENIEDIVKGFIKPFDLSKAPLLRVELLENKDDKYLLVDMHHIISDGMSLNILLKEFLQLYAGNSLEPLKYQYKDFSEWQNTNLNSETGKAQEDYWLNTFKGEIPVLKLPLDYDRPMTQSFEGDSYSFVLDKELTDKIMKLEKQTNTTLHMFMVTAINILLSKYSGQNDIVIGTPVSGRQHADLKNIIGMFVNSLALRNNPTEDKTFISFLQEVKDNSIAAYENQGMPFELLVEKLKVERDATRNPLFDVEINLIDSIDNNSLRSGNVLIEQQLSSENMISKFDLTFNISESIDNIYLGIDYCTKLFKKQTIERMSEHLINIIEQIIENEQIKLRDIQIITKKEKDQILNVFNDTKKQFRENITIKQMFEEQVKKAPDHIALVFGDEKLTYNQVNEKSNSIANYLVEKGVKPESIVSVMLDRSFEMIISILAILKAGGAYLPIDASYPESRIKYMLEDSKTSIVLTEEKYKYLVNENIDVINVKDEALYNKSTENLSDRATPDNLAYIIYTSGTTSNPKGVMVENKTIMNTLQWRIDLYKFDENDATLQMPSYAFDSSVEDIFTSLLSGAKLVLMTNEDKSDLVKVSKIIEHNKVTHMLAVPSLYNMYLTEIPADLHTLKKVTVAGESTTSALVKKHFQVFDNVDIYNEYGPTENSVCSTIYKFDKNTTKILIGKPISNVKCYITDKNMNLLPVGVDGEICVSGKGVARGYLDKPDMTNEKFIPNPFEAGERVYKTGDLGKWDADGNIEFLGRVDNQVKIRGYRIEIEEIENQLMKIEHMKEVAVVAKEKVSTNEKYLSAYFVAEQELSENEIKNQLSKFLPQYMIPEACIQLQQMPLTPNGKCDKNKLIKLADYQAKKVEYKEPQTELEKKICSLCEEILGVEKVGLLSNFFDMGGHSLKAMILVSKIHKELNKELPLSQIFKTPVIGDLTQYLSSVGEDEYCQIEIAEDKSYYKASSAQKRTYMLQQFDKKSTVYNLPSAYQLVEGVDLAKIQDAFKQLVERHDAFRTYFGIDSSSIIQKINKELKLEVPIIELDEKQTIDDEIKNFVRPFDLNRPPLIRVELVKKDEKSYILIDIHHIIADGVSMNILLKEFTDIYFGHPLKSLRLQYKDYSEWQHEYLQTEKMKNQEKYWLDMFSEEVPALSMPLDYDRPVVQAFEGNEIRFSFGEELTEKVRKLAKQTNTTVHMIMLSILNVVLSKYSGQEDIVVGTPVMGRPQEDLENIIGIFINTLALRNKPNKEKTYIEFLNEVKANSLAAYQNQSYQFEELIDKLNLKRDTSRNPLFDVMINIQDTIEAKSSKELLFAKSVGRINNISKVDLTLNVDDAKNDIYLGMQYCIKLFNEDTIQILCEHFKHIAKQLLDNQNVKLQDVELITEVERKQVVCDFNETNFDYNRNTTLKELFEVQVEKTPDLKAIIFEDKEITYRQLNEKANSLAHMLMNKGVSNNSIVAVMVKRSIDMIIAILAVLKTGAAYLPIDSNYPKDRIEYMIKDSNCKIILSQKDVIEQKLMMESNHIDVTKNEIYEKDKDNLITNCKPDSLAYVIYTSGTTGTPKGVMIEHRNVVNFIYGIIDKTHLDDYKTMLNITTVSFDIFGLELHVPLAIGQTIVLANETQQRDAVKLARLINEQNVEIIQSTPTRMDALVEDDDFKNALHNVRIMLVGGEELKRNLAEKLLQSTNIRLFDVYGPTETTIWSTIKEITKADERITIGKPIANTKIYIMNKENHVLPVSVQGELCIGGEGVGRGYMNRQDLTDAKFIPNTYDTGKIYKTGDLAKWLSNGEIAFCGRADNQIKLRGFRIELGEIENKLAEYSDINKVVVLLKNKNKYLCAYYESDKDIDIGALKMFLKKKLPDYMIPSQFVKVEKMPLNANGKIDRKQLETIKITHSKSSMVKPRTLQERVISDIWIKVLEYEDDIYIYDDFFELGGNSINIINVIAMIKKELGVELDISEVMSNSKLSELAEFTKQKTSMQSDNKYKHLFKLNNSKSTKNIFAIHGANCNVLTYINVAKEMQDEYTVYALQPKGLTGNEPLPQSILEMDSDYFAEIKKAQPEGPYIILATCIGTSIAYDIASVLEAQGCKDTRVIMIDLFPSAVNAPKSKLMLNEGRVKAIEVKRKLLREDYSYTLKQMKEAYEEKYIISPEESKTIIESSNRLFDYFSKDIFRESHHIALSPKLKKTKVLVIRAERTFVRDVNEATWSEVVSDLKFEILPGEHDTILMKPYVDRVVEEIRKFLAE